jgi:pimeloyl-ACP methyl ester carboxylesterase
VETRRNQRRVKRALKAAFALLVLTAFAGPGAHANQSPGVRQIHVLVASPPLQGTLTLPAGHGPFPGLVMLSGSGPTDQDVTAGPNKPFRDIALGLAARGIASLRLDKRALDYPKSIDPLTATAIQEYVPDALAALRFLRHRSEIKGRPTFVLGHSMGGTFAPLVAKRAGAQVAGVILLAAGSEPFGAMILRQLRYLATLPDPIGAQARAQLPDVERIAPVLDSPALANADPSKAVYQGYGPAYFLSLQRYDEIATAGDRRSLDHVDSKALDDCCASRWVRRTATRESPSCVRSRVATRASHDRTP